VLTNQDLEKMVDTTDQWILERTGISERHIAAPGVATSDMAVEAARCALLQRGIGATEIDFPTDGGHRRNEELWTFPVGFGLKYPIRRWLAARAEFADQLALGNNGVATQHDLTLTFGLEWRFGARQRSYWPWNPSRHIW